MSFVTINIIKPSFNANTVATRVNKLLFAAFVRFCYFIVCHVSSTPDSSFHLIITHSWRIIPSPQSHILSGVGRCCQALLLISFTLLFDNDGEKENMLTHFLFMVLCASLIYWDVAAGEDRDLWRSNVAAVSRMRDTGPYTHKNTNTICYSGWERIKEDVLKENQIYNYVWMTANCSVS